MPIAYLLILCLCQLFVSWCLFFFGCLMLDIMLHPPLAYPFCAMVVVCAWPLKSLSCGLFTVVCMVWCAPLCFFFPFHVPVPFWCAFSPFQSRAVVRPAGVHVWPAPVLVPHAAESGGSCHRRRSLLGPASHIGQLTHPLCTSGAPFTLPDVWAGVYQSTILCCTVIPQATPPAQLRALVLTRTLDHARMPTATALCLRTP